ncbi:MAG: hypothetical protein GY953_12655, partial [bacterium]|nr:hypothetical protein [bacterium]
MITTDSQRRPPEAELAALLYGLRHRGLAVGVDDAARIERLFRHAGDWSHQRRVRALKLLLARSDEERGALDQLAPFLFFNAEKRTDGASAKTPDVHPQTPSPTQATPDPVGRSRHTEVEPHETPAVSRETRRRWWLAAALATVLIVVGILRVGSQLPVPELPPVIPSPPPPQQAAVPPLVSPPSASPKDQEIKIRTPPPPPRWPFVLLLGVSALVVWVISSRSIRARQQEVNIRAVAKSKGARSYRLELPEARTGNPQNAHAVREAAFHLSAPMADAPAAWLDVHRTVETTVRNAGRLTLRWATWREHRPLLFIEDVSSSMACWPGFGQQIAAGILRQGGDVERYFMNGTPEFLFSDPDLRRPV